MKTEQGGPDRICGRPGCGKKLTRANKSGFCTKHFYDSRTPAGARGAENCTKCGKLLRRDNRSGVCKGCREGQSPKAVQRLQQQKANGAATNGNGHATVSVTGDQLLAMFTAWPLEDQVAAVQHVLDRSAQQ